MISGLHLCSYANNLGIINAYNSQAWIEGDLRARSTFSSTSTNPDINLSRGYFEVSSTGSSKMFPRFQIIRFVGVGGGGGGAGYYGGGVGGYGSGGGAGKAFNFLGKITKGSVYLGGGYAGSDYITGGQIEGHDGNAIFPLTMYLSTASSYGMSANAGAGGRKLNDSPPSTTYHGIKSTKQPYGNGGDGYYYSGGYVDPKWGHMGYVDVQGLIW